MKVCSSHKKSAHLPETRTEIIHRMATTSYQATKNGKEWMRTQNNKDNKRRKNQAKNWRMNKTMMKIATVIFERIIDGFLLI